MEIREDDSILVAKIKQLSNKIELFLIMKKYKREVMKTYTDIGYYTYLNQGESNQDLLIQEKLNECNALMEKIRQIKTELKMDRNDYFQDRK